MVLWFYLAQPKTEEGIDVFKVVPILFGINLLLGIVFYYLKKHVGLIFMGN